MKQPNQKDSQTKKSTGKSGSFKDNPERASEAGRKGGQNSHGTSKS